MKLVFIIGDAAMGKMTVGQELMKITDLRLFHNHMTIEPVLEIMGTFDGQLINDMRELIFRRFAVSDNYGMIFTIMMAFDMQSDWDYLEHVKSIFVPYGTEFYYVELIAPQEVRLRRNRTENRLQHKPSKRDIEVSDRRLSGRSALRELPAHRERRPARRHRGPDDQGPFRSLIYFPSSHFVTTLPHHLHGTGLWHDVYMVVEFTVTHRSNYLL